MSAIEVVKWLAINDPKTATPMAPPICRVVSFTALPTPALARGSEPMIESVHGAITCDMPTAISIITKMMCKRAAVRLERREQDERQRHDREAGGDDELVAEAAHPDR